MSKTTFEDQYTHIKSIEDALNKIINICISQKPLDHSLIEFVNSQKQQFENLSEDKIRYLFEKILMAQKPSHGIRILEELGLIKMFIPELQSCVGFDQRNPHHDDDVFEHILKVLDNAPPEATLRYAALFHDIAKPETFFLDESGKGRFFGHDRKGAKMARNILMRFGYAPEFIGDVASLIENHMSHYNGMKESGVRKLMGRMGQKNIERLFKLQKADITGRKGPHNLKNMESMKKIAESLIKEMPPDK